MVERPIFVISAPSGGGKNSLINLVLQREPRLRHSISTTTREKRGGEIEGVHYHFLSRAEFEKRIADNKFLEYAHLLDNYYGTEIAEIERIFAAGKYPILDIDIQGAQILRQKISHIISIFIMPPSLGELERRLRERGSESQLQIQERLQLAENEILKKDDFHYVVVNDDLMQAAEALLEILRHHIVE